MKKLESKSKSIFRISALLLVLAIGLCTGCKKEEENPSQEASGDVKAGTFCVGYSRKEIEPSDSVPLGGYGNTLTRMSEGFIDGYIYTDCTAITGENGETILLFVSDAIRQAKAITESARIAISNATGVPKDHIYFNASHSHSTPDNTKTSYAAIQRYDEKWVEQMTKAAIEAMADRSESTMWTGTSNVQGLNFVRHYLLADGTWAGDNFGHMDKSTPVAHETDADTEMRGLCFKREGKKSILLCNWQCHPHIWTKTNLNVSPDFVGWFRTEAENTIGDIYVDYVNGFGGNINERSSISGEMPPLDTKIYGGMLAEYAVDIYNSLKQAETGDVAILQERMTANCDHSMDGLIVGARIVANQWEATNDYDSCTKLANEYGLNSPYAASSVISKASLPKSTDFEINAVRLGSVGFITVPFECYDTQGVFIRENSPFDFTLTIGYANESQGYLPAQISFDHGCYERDTTNFEVGTAEKLASRLVEMLVELKK